MKRATLPIVLLTALAIAAAPARATLCDLDEVPAATLLLPYFETNLAAPGLETIVVIRNADKNPVLANLVIWSDVGIPVLSFPIALKGFDSYDFSLYNLLTGGVLPASEPSTFPSCGGLLPVPTLTATLRTALQQSLTGQPVTVLGGLCQGLALTGRPTVAHGYITVDVVRQCTTLFPGQPSYFVNGGKGIATNDNKLMGQSLFLDQAKEMAHDEPMVHIEAGTFSQGDYTFYGRLVSWSGDDEREPLATNFGIGFAHSGFYGTTDLFVWRDPRRVQAPFACATPPGKLTQTAAISIDEEGAITIPPTAVAYFPAAAQRVDLVASGLRPAPPAAGDFGWFFFNLGHRLGTYPTAPQRLVAQGWVYGVTNSAPPPPIYMGSFEATRLDSACRGKAKPNARQPRLP